MTDPTLVSTVEPVTVADGTPAVPTERGPSMISSTHGEEGNRQRRPLARLRACPGMADLDAETPTPAAVGRPSSAERSAACVAILSYVFCSVIGPLLAWWWSRTADSTHARRYAILSLLLDVPTLVGLVLIVPFALAGHTNTVALIFLVLWLIQALLGLYSLVLAVYAWRGRDISDAPVPRSLVRRIG